MNRGDQVVYGDNGMEKPAVLIRLSSGPFTDLGGREPAKASTIRDGKYVGEPGKGKIIRGVTHRG